MLNPGTKSRSRRTIKTGMAPGTPVFVGEQKLEHARIDVIDYDGSRLTESLNVTPDRCAEFARDSTVTWINVTGVHDLGVIEALGSRFNLHPLTKEDIVNTTQRPKIETFPEYLFIVLKMMTYDPTESRIGVEHVSLILGENFVISFLEDEGDVFDSVRNRIRFAKGSIRSMKSDFLAYALMDAVIDHYFIAIERIGDVIEEIDDRIVDNPEPADIHEIHRLKREILTLRKAVWPLREEIRALEQSGSFLIREGTGVFLLDLYDHTIQVIDMVETFRDLLSGMHDTYLSSISNRMNEIMKVLTIIATIFIPLTFIVGVYGMNFEHMPELKWHWGYYTVWGVMLTIAVGMMFYFKRKNWI